MKLNLSKLKVIVPTVALACAVAGGCGNANKKAQQASASPLNAGALNVPATPPPAPPAAFTPPAPPQPVVYDAPADQPVIQEAAVDASDSAAAPALVARPRTTRSAGGTKYKIKKGESLWSIAQARYGNGNKWKAIAAANPKIDPNRVQAGQTIVLP